MPPKPKNRMIKADDTRTREAITESGTYPVSGRTPVPMMARVRANVRLAEAGTLYAPGDEFTVAQERAASLGDLVTFLCLTY
jgi:hypothetical protein